ncbi:MAG: serine hydrolase [Gemmatimonadaceae bacterium]
MRLFAALVLCVGLTQPTVVHRAPHPVPRPATVQRPAPPPYDALEQFIVHERRDKHLPAVSIALVDDQRIVWSKGFGYANPADSTPATATTIYRVGSVSKLFTDIAVMQLVEKGALSLDAPLSRYLPDFTPHNPFGTPITLRELMSHRAGLVREPPVGHYFDASSPSLAATVQSLDSTTLVYEPHTHTKYSNAGVAVVGRVLEVTQHAPFATYLSRAVLRPMGLTHSAFARESTFTKDVATGYMWTYDGRTFPAPTFDLGMAPAGSMYTSVTDLAHFLSVLFAGGRGPHGRVLKQKTLDAMWTPQFAYPGDSAGYGLGFALSRLDGHRVIGHGGAIYGFATQLAALPDDKLGVVVVTTEDGANAVTSRIADAALRVMLAAREHRAPPTLDTTTAVPPALARQLAGRYGVGDHAVDLAERNGALILQPVRGGFHAALRMLHDTLIVDDRLAYGTRVLRAGDAIVITGDTLRPVTLPMPHPAPDAWHGLIGEYGWDYNTLYVLEKDGRLQALIEWFFEYPLDEQSPDHFRFPRWGLYDNEPVTFTRDANGRATAVRVGGVTFPRRATGPEDGSQFRITPVRPVAELRAAALAATPPHESGDFRPSDLVELVTLDSSIHLDIRYASANNFMGTPMYQEARAFMQRPAAEAVARASQWLHQRGYGLLIHDAYRPWFVTKMFWDATPVDKHVFVADPSEGSRHNRGCAVDLTLYDLATGAPIVMTGGYDEMTDRSYPDYPGGTALERWHRALLRQAMELQGFTVYDAEWWHFDYVDWRHYAIGNVPFEKIGR